jgi:transposase-like protein
MTTYTKYSKEFKSALVQKVLSKPENSVTFISREAGIPSSTLKNWVNNYKNKNGFDMNKNKSKKLSSEEKFNIVVLTASMNEAEKSEYCRKNGFYPEEIEQWRKECISSFQNDPGNKNKLKKSSKEKELEEKNKELEKELNRKDKALAETAALLTLKKKARKIWGDPEDE